MSEKVIHLWTDGSSINHGEGKGLGGYGYVLLYGDFTDVDITTEYCDEKFRKTGFKGATNTTNQKEELKSVIAGLKQIKNKDITIHVFSDSAYLVNCMNDGWYHNWRSNGWKNSKKQPVESKEIWEELLDVIESDMLMVKFNKIKGHSKIFYNELADKLARQGLDEVRKK